MIDIVKRFFGNLPGTGTHNGDPDSVHDIRVATCALFVEMAKIDDEFTAKELEAVLDILKDRYALSPDHADALIAAADQQLEQSVDLWRFAESINANYSNSEKKEILETLWRIVYVDRRMDAHENYLMHKVGNLLRLSHKDLMDAKLKVLHENK
jgi:uncharacterized tellurite resistance protein B-like protein